MSSAALKNPPPAVLRPGKKPVFKSDLPLALRTELRGKYHLVIRAVAAQVHQRKTS